MLFYAGQTKAYERLTSEMELGSSDPMSVLTRGLLVDDISQEKATELASHAEQMLSDVENKHCDSSNRIAQSGSEKA